MAVSEQDVLQALAAVVDPHTGQNFVATRSLRNLHISGGDVAFDVELGYPAKSLIAPLRSSFGLATGISRSPKRRTASTGARPSAR